MTNGGSPRDAAFMFASTGDWTRAVQSLRESLASDPHDAPALSLLSLGLGHIDQPAEAVDAGRRAVAEDPELGLAHYALGQALFADDDVAGAERAAREALRLDPDSDGYSLLGHVYARQRRWQQALDASMQGLELDPEHVGCANLRARALDGLGRRDEAGRVARKTLAADPEHAGTHLNHGWLSMRSGNYDEALERFRTALRLDPTLDGARAGIVEALKARNGVYRVFLRYTLWLNNLDARTRWFILIGLFLGGRIARQALRDNPELTPVLGPAIVLYTLFALSTWIAEPLSNLLLRLNPFGRLVLTKADTVASNLVGGCLATVVVAGLLGVLTSIPGFFVTAVVAFLLLLPISGAFSGYGTRAWGVLRAALIAIAALGVTAIGLSIVSNELAVWPLVAMVVGVFAFGWGANYVIIKYS